MFIIVKFGANEEELFNPECPIRILLEDVKKRCNCMERDCIGFMDDKGGLVNLTDDRSMESAGRYFTHRTVYTLIAVNKKGEMPTYVPLVEDPSKELLVKLESLSTGSKNLKTSNNNRRGSKTPQTVSNKPPSSKASKRK